MFAHRAEIDIFDFDVGRRLFDAVGICLRNRGVHHIVDRVRPEKKVVVVVEIRLKREDRELPFEIFPADRAGEKLRKRIDERDKIVALLRAVGSRKGMQDLPERRTDKIFTRHHRHVNACADKNPELSRLHLLRSLLFTSGAARLRRSTPPR